MPAVLIPSMGLVFLVLPDPREIAKNLRLYYPDLVIETKSQINAPSANGFRAWVSHYPLLVAFVASFSAQGTMGLMMAMTSLALAHHGHAYR